MSKTFAERTDLGQLPAPRALSLSWVRSRDSRYRPDVVAGVEDPEQSTQALDTVRVIGNDAVHPGQIDLRDDRDTAIQLFELVNFIADQTITRKNRVASMYAKLPQAKRDDKALARSRRASTPSSNLRGAELFIA